MHSILCTSCLVLKLTFFLANRGQQNGKNTTSDTSSACQWVFMCILTYFTAWIMTNVFQERIARAHGSQCGFCTPGIVMSMYALLRNNSTPKMADVEEAFHGTARDRWTLFIWKKNGICCLLWVHQEKCALHMSKLHWQHRFLFLFFFYFRKFVSLHRIQSHTGGIQDFHRGETHHTSAHRKSDMFIWKSKLSRSMIKRSNLFSPQRQIMFPLICRVIYPSRLFWRYHL